MIIRLSLTTKGLIRDFLFISVVGVQLGFAVVLGPIQLEDLECEVIFFFLGPFRPILTVWVRIKIQSVGFN